MAPSANSALVDPGVFHRLAIATDDDTDLAGWLISVLGARRLKIASRQVQGLPFGSDTLDGTMEESGARSEIVWVGNTPFCLLVSTSPEGPLGRFVARNGTGLHSVAWTVEDFWTADATLRREGLRITGVDIAGRHFFLHPSDTVGLLTELTDTYWHVDPRDDPSAHADPSPTDSVVTGAQIRWMNVAVPDLAEAESTLSALLTMKRVEGLPTEDCSCCESIDLAVSDAVIRLVRATDPTSRYADVGKSQRLHSFCVGVPDLAEAEAALVAHGIPVISRDDTFFWTDPAQTCGLRLQWVQN
jgi:methylmalonyl-CoA/ethylmalonyl-CoA epimerase